MPHYEVVFKLGFEEDADNIEDAVFLAKQRLAYVILHNGVETFAIDVDGEAYPQ